MPREAIRSLPIFRGLSPEDVDILAGSFERRSYPAGSVIFGQGETASELYVLVSGRVVIRFEPYDGDVLTVAEIGPGEVFGWSAALDRPSYTSCAVAVDECETIAIQGVELRRLCKAEPRIGVIILERLAEVIAERLRSTHAKVVELLQHGMHSATGV